MTFLKRICFSVTAGGALLLGSASASADTSAFTIIDDQAISDTIAAVRADYLAHRTWDRLNCTMLIKQPDGTWKRGSFNPAANQYPASCVKLTYLASAMYWCRINGHPYTYLDADVRPMITVSDNYATGRVVDAITGASNFSGPSAPGAIPYDEWKARRFFTEDFLASRGLLGTQRTLSKTYPTNSGNSPSGYEQQIINDYSGNLMQSGLSASLMLEIIYGAIEPDANTYMRGLLTHDRWDDDAVIGSGIPPGSIYENKLGVAYDTVEDIAYVKMPNDQEFILAIFTNSWKTSDPLPYDAYQPAPFTEKLIDALGLNEGNPPRVIVDDADGAFSTSGAWTIGTAQPDKYAATYRFANGGSGAAATFTLNPPEAGRYEVSVWFPQGTNRGTNVPFTVHHANGESVVTVNEQNKGGLWVRLGDYDFNAGAGSVEVGTSGVSSSYVVIADAVRIAKFPGTGPTPTPSPSPSPVVDGPTGFVIH